MYQNRFLFLSLLLQLRPCLGLIDRDLRLTPQRGLQILGRTLYFAPNKNYTNGITPWEQSLKHVTFLTLFPQIGNYTTPSDKEYTEFMRSHYTRIGEEFPRFGDIVTLARGWVEKSNGHHFVEGVCEKKCLANALALWRVQKIRHRDSQRGFRYEIKISVTLVKDKDGSNNNIFINDQYFKSFILKDDDYPNSFARKSDSLSSGRQGRIVNDNPRKENDIISQLTSLNIGEYFKEIPNASSKIGYVGSSRNVFPTTYRPDYVVKFPKTELYDTSEEPNMAVVTHHFHHHFFMKDSAPSTHHDQPLFHSKTDTIQVEERPKAELMHPQYTINVHTSPINTQTEPTPPPVFYMQQIPLYIQSYPHEEITSQVGGKPFEKSDQQFEEIRYSDPDPLYKNFDSLEGSSESNFGGVHLQIERPSAHITHVSDSIKSELPTQNENQATSASNDDTKKADTKNPTKRLTSYSSSQIPAYTTNRIDSETPSKNVSKISLPKIRTYLRSTTEQPVLKWKPRRKLKDKDGIEENTLSNSSTQEDLITVTPITLGSDESEVITHKSVSKTVSIKIGNRTEEYRFPDSTLF